MCQLRCPCCATGIGRLGRPVGSGMLRFEDFRRLVDANPRLHEYETVSDARAGLSRYFPLYNEERIHESLGYLTPAQVYRQGMVPGMAC